MKTSFRPGLNFGENQVNGRVSELHYTLLVPRTWVSSDDVDRFLTLRIDPLEEGRSTMKAWPNRLTQDHQGPNLSRLSTLVVSSLLKIFAAYFVYIPPACLEAPHWAPNQFDVQFALKEEVYRAFSTEPNLVNAGNNKLRESSVEAIPGPETSIGVFNKYNIETTLLLALFKAITLERVIQIYLGKVSKFDILDSSRSRDNDSSSLLHRASSLTTCSLVVAAVEELATSSFPFYSKGLQSLEQAQMYHTEVLYIQDEMNIDGASIPIYCKGVRRVDTSRGRSLFFSFNLHLELVGSYQGSYLSIGSELRPSNLFDHTKIHLSLGVDFIGGKYLVVRDVRSLFVTYSCIHWANIKGKLSPERQAYKDKIETFNNLLSTLMMRLNKLEQKAYNAQGRKNIEAIDNLMPRMQPWEKSET
ncbi:hypothetical protein M9H77_23853 [Catharanthus roseus]|uniref:Uncharacterized protein n=1 Tax=Catharanthus roseus TaxID=4058 RepID=A0ACC0AW01_CATRO|nr:hypothetical protein M9H77_23853 [Catharanthus roseus]